MTDAVIFDIGNVLMRFDYRPFLRDLFGDERLAARVDDAVWGSPWWRAMDLGMGRKRAQELMIARDPEIADAIVLALDRVGECMLPEEYAIPWLRELKDRGERLYYLSNYSEYSMTAGPSALSFLPYMDGGVFSCRVYLGKPDPAIYRHLFRQYSLDPAHCVFIDDSRVNTAAAESLGLPAILFRSFSQAKTDLEMFLQ